MKLTDDQHEKLKKVLSTLIGKELEKYIISKEYTFNSFIPGKHDQVGRKKACKIINEYSYKCFPESDQGRKEFKRYVDTCFKLKGPYNWHLLKK